MSDVQLNTRKETKAGETWETQKQRHTVQYQKKRKRE